MMTPTETKSILVEALVLALTAPTQSKAEQATELAETVAATLPPEAIEECKHKALQRLLEPTQDHVVH